MPNCALAECCAGTSCAGAQRSRAIGVGAVPRRGDIRAAGDVVNVRPQAEARAMEREAD